jgi:hypothetical protein
MADGVFNISKGKISYYGGLPATSDAIKCLLLKSTGLVADATLTDYDTITALLAGASDECDFTDYVRKTLASITVTVDDTNDRVDIDCADITWTGAGGASNNTIGKLVTFYVPDTGTESDTTNIPLTYHDFVYTTSNVDVTAQVATAGFGRAA